MYFVLYFLPEKVFQKLCKLGVRSVTMIGFFFLKEFTVVFDKKN